MPNMLAHFGAQGVLTRTVWPKADLKIIFLGCLLPDVPWIFARIAERVPLDINLYSVRAYAIAQASLLVTLFLCGALAAISVHPKKVFGILTLNVILHLFLDALQTKWANGVHFFAPFSWTMLNFELFWPESLPTYLLTLLGLLYAGWLWRQAIAIPPPLPYLTLKRVAFSLALLLGYFGLPLIFLQGPWLADNHSIKTLQAKAGRVGQPVEFDRAPYTKGENGDYVISLGKEKIQTLPHHGTRSGMVSVRGRFVAPNTIQILEFHQHVWWFRDSASYIGLVLLLSMWSVAWIRNS